MFWFRVLWTTHISVLEFTRTHSTLIWAKYDTPFSSTQLFQLSNQLFEISVFEMSQWVKFLESSLYHSITDVHDFVSCGVVISDQWVYVLQLYGIVWARFVAHTFHQRRSWSHHVQTCSWTWIVSCRVYVCGWFLFVFCECYQWNL